MTFPSVHGGGGHAFTHARATYNWADDAIKCYRLACDLIGVEVARKRLLKLLIEPLPEIEIAEAIE